MWLICILVWCIFLTCVLTAISLEQKIIAEVEQDLPVSLRPSCNRLNGRAVATEARMQHALKFPHSKLRLQGALAWIGAVASLCITFAFASRVFGL